MLLVRTKKSNNLILKDFKQMEAKWGPYVVTVAVYVYSSIPEIYFMQGIIGFCLTYKEEWLNSVWSTLKPLRFLLLQFKEIKVSLNGFSGTSVLMFTSKTPKGSQITCSI